MKKLLGLMLILFTGTACNKYLDVVPDNVATLEYAFSVRSTAERYLHTCYSWMPSHSDYTSNPALTGGDELWLPPNNTTVSWSIARGLQTATSPRLNYWDGNNGAKNLYDGIRDCNVFLENVGKVPDIEEYERTRWIAEVKFLKAYYHFWLLRMYGAIPIIDENLPIDVSTEKARPERQPFDKVMTYIVNLIDECMVDLPETIDNKTYELGRISRMIALAAKTEMLVLAASPLFNGNSDYINLKNKSGETLINPVYSAQKWADAAQAAKEAIEMAHILGHKLYEFSPNNDRANISDTTQIQMGIRNSLTERNNEEVIWANVNSVLHQPSYSPRTWDPSRTAGVIAGHFGPTMKIANLFYSDKGLPIQDDKTYDYNGRYQLKTAGVDERYNIKQGYTTVGLHFNRENRFYASIGFDGGIWYGQGRYDDNADLFYIMGKSGQATSIYNVDFYSVTGYWPKKLINYQNVIEASSYTNVWYSWPVIRLASLYLWYAEALNEVSGGSTEALSYLNKVRERAGIPTVEDSWINYSNDPAKYTNQVGLREIIHQERMIEFVFEGQRYWDLRRWKKALNELSKPISGWNLSQKDASGYYIETILFQQKFRQRDYLWPISENEMQRNDKLVQNPGW